MYNKYFKKIHLNCLSNINLLNTHPKKNYPIKNPTINVPEQRIFYGVVLDAACIKIRLVVGARVWSVKLVKSKTLVDSRLFFQCCYSSLILSPHFNLKPRIRSSFQTTPWEYIVVGCLVKSYKTMIKGATLFHLCLPPMASPSQSTNFLIIIFILFSFILIPTINAVPFIVLHGNVFIHSLLSVWFSKFVGSLTCLLYLWGVTYKLMLALGNYSTTNFQIWIILLCFFHSTSFGWMPLGVSLLVSYTETTRVVRRVSSVGLHRCMEWKTNLNLSALLGSLNLL